MKRFTYFSLAILALTSIAAISASAQTDYKFGKVTRAELERTDYPAIVDGADAVALEDLTDLLIIADSCFDAKFDAFARFYYSHRKVIRKIKILNSDGLRYANIKIPHRHARHPRTFDSSTEGIRGYSYTLKDGKIKPIETESNGYKVANDRRQHGASGIYHTRRRGRIDNRIRIYGIRDIDIPARHIRHHAKRVSDIELPLRGIVQIGWIP